MTCTSAAGVLLAALAVGACGIGGPGIQPRYFSASGSLDATLPLAVADEQSAHVVELAPARAVGHLRERMVWRDGAGEVGFYEGRRWSESPVELLERGLAAALAAEPGVVRATGRADWTLDVRLEEFGELREDGSRAEVRLRAVLTGRGGAVALQRRFVEEVPVEADDPRALARALGTVLGRQLSAVAAAVAVELDRRGAVRTTFD